jgi:hypothetical protein
MCRCRLSCAKKISCIMHGANSTGTVPPGVPRDQRRQVVCGRVLFVPARHVSQEAGRDRWCVVGWLCGSLFSWSASLSEDRASISLLVFQWLSLAVFYLNCLFDSWREKTVAISLIYKLPIPRWPLKEKTRVYLLFWNNIKNYFLFNQYTFLPHATQEDQKEINEKKYN